LFYLVAFEFLVKVSNIYTAFSCNDIESRFFTLEICTILSLENFSENENVFSQIFWKKLKAYPSFGNWQVKNLSKNHRKTSLQKKQVCKKVCIFKKMQQQVCKNKKSKSSKKSTKSLHIQKIQEVCKNKKQVCKKSAK